MFSILNSYLDNGLKIMLKKVPHGRTVSCGVWINQGSKDEDYETNGLSHLIEHLMLKTQSRRSHDTMQKCISEILDLGYYYNGTTTKESTCFYIDGLNKNLEKMIQTLSYMVIDKDTVTEEILANEKEIVLREAEGYLASSSQIGERVGQALWGNRSFGQLTIGNPDVIKNATVDQINSIIKNIYVPANATIVVVGAFEFDEILEQIENYFAQWQDKYFSKKEYIVQSTPGIFIENKFKGLRSTIGIGFSTFESSDPRSRYVGMIKDAIICPGGNIFNEIREKRGLVYSLDGFSMALSEVGSMGIAFSATNDKITEIIGLLFEGLKLIKKNGIEDRQLEKIKRLRETQLLFNLESVPKQLMTIGNNALNGNNFFLEEELRAINKVTKQEINYIINEILLTDNLAFAMLGNCDMEAILPMLEI